MDCVHDRSRPHPPPGRIASPLLQHSCQLRTGKAVGYIRPIQQANERRLFVSKKKDEMISAEDLLKIVENNMLRDLSKILQRHGKSNTDYRIDEPNEELSRETMDSTTEIDDGAKDFLITIFLCSLMNKRGF